MLNGDREVKIEKFIDDRGTLLFPKFLPSDFLIKRFYLVENHQQNFVRAWHGHKQEKKVAFSIKGSFLVALVPMDAPETTAKTFIVSDDSGGLVIPTNFYNGWMNLTRENILGFLSDKTAAESKGDDYRRDWREFGGEEMFKPKFR